MRQRLSLLVLGSSCALLACSSSVLIRANDCTFWDAQRHLQRTTAAVGALRTQEAERTIFLQAEGLYRYRFSPPPRSAASHLAQMAAVTAELPVLQAYAGSLDLLDLRLRTSDGAVQLWESLLALYPNTALRPLTLYRLGWAYRSAGVGGLPRESGEEAFHQLRRDYPTSPLAPLAQQALSVQWKSKDAAAAWSIVPGLGQMYVGDYGNGAIHLAIAAAALATVVVPAVIAYQRRDELSWGNDWPLLAAAVGGVIVLSIDYTIAYQGAQREVVLFNERAEAKFENEHCDAP